jgi:hypothetical protein
MPRVKTKRAWLCERCGGGVPSEDCITPMNAGFGAAFAKKEES